MLIKEYRVVLPLTVEEYQVGQLYSVAQASKDNTGGGEGIEVVKNEPCDHAEFGKGQYTYKIYHLDGKVPRWIRKIAPKGSLEIHEEAWNCYPYCRTVLKNPDYMKDNFSLIVETWHKDGCADIDNVHNLDKDKLKQREVVLIDIGNDPIDPASYKEDEDPTKFKSEKTGRGPLTGKWQESASPVMTCYKLVSFEFKWFGLQTFMERKGIEFNKNLFTMFHRQLFCWLDKWHGMTMGDIRELEEKTKAELDDQRQNGEAKSTMKFGD
ncbi:phosphatidylinositol transfer protein beta isoform-like [Sycon ciliatum]|uniref:phosphatidylinositol transfer protein beta isoform-like n=1 Tax=Sycon ciliatum TaxID=27933 RepID=UPI0020A98C3C|eukprot:scpid90530/ scgid12724/ Phosphatidylinositol transfer protein beta isoform